LLLPLLPFHTLEVGLFSPMNRRFFFYFSLGSLGLMTPVFRSSFSSLLAAY